MLVRIFSGQRKPIAASLDQTLTKHIEWRRAPNLLLTCCSIHSGTQSGRAGDRALNFPIVEAPKWRIIVPKQSSAIKTAVFPRSLTTHQALLGPRVSRIISRRQPIRLCSQNKLSNGLLLSHASENPKNTTTESFLFGPPFNSSAIPQCRYPAPKNVSPIFAGERKIISVRH